MLSYPTVLFSEILISSTFYLDMLVIHNVFDPDGKAYDLGVNPDSTIWGIN